MAGGGGRKLRAWLVEQVESGRFAGLVWDNAERSAVRIPWQHAGKGGARGGAGTALCQAWAEFKGRLRPGARPDPAGWKTRLRCALNKSPEFREVPARSRLEGPRPYKVYEILPAPGQRGGQTPRGGGSRPRKEAGRSPTAGGDGAPQPRETPAPPPSSDEAPAEEPRPDDGDPSEAPPPAAVTLSIVVDSPEPLPPVQEVGRHRAGLGPCPEHRVTLAVGQELGPHDGPHNRTLVLQLEQAFAQQLLDSTLDAAGPPCPLPLQA